MYFDEYKLRMRHTAIKVYLLITLVTIGVVIILFKYF